MKDFAVSFHISRREMEFVPVIGLGMFSNGGAGGEEK